MKVNGKSYPMYYMKSKIQTTNQQWCESNQSPIFFMVKKPHFSHMVTAIFRETIPSGKLT